MTAHPLRIRYMGDQAYAVFEGDQQITGRCGCYQQAETRLGNILKDRRKKPRPCLCCGTMMDSTGPGHRLCDPCRDDVGSRSWVA